jgi:hypothetical protein
MRRPCEECIKSLKFYADFKMGQFTACPYQKIEEKRGF